MTGWSDADIKALCDNATPGPWEWSTSEATMNDRSGYRFGPRSAPAAFLAHQMRRSDAEFIAAARDLVPELLARAQQAEAERDDLRRDLLAETYRPEGVEIVMRTLVEVKAERDRLTRELECAQTALTEAFAEANDENDRLRAELAEARADVEHNAWASRNNERLYRTADAKVQAVEAFRDRVRDERAAVECSRDAGDNSGGARDYAQGAIDALRRVDERITAALAAVSSEPEDGER